MGGHSPAFSSNIQLNSLVLSRPTATLRPFTVTHWASDGELIYLDDSNPTKECSLEILWTPGHTPDSIAIYSHWENRLFIGDNLYPFAAVHLDCLGSSVSDFLQSLKKLMAFCDAVQVRTNDPSRPSLVRAREAAERSEVATLSTEPTALSPSEAKTLSDSAEPTALSSAEATTLPPPATPTSSSPSANSSPIDSTVDSLSPPDPSPLLPTTPTAGLTPTTLSNSVQSEEEAVNRLLIDDFLGVVGLSRESAEATFNLVGLLELCEWSVQQAVDMYLTSSDTVVAICPPLATAVSFSNSTSRVSSSSSSASASAFFILLL